MFSVLALVSVLIADPTPKFKSEYAKASEEVKQRSIYIFVGSVTDTFGVTPDFRCDSLAGYADGVYYCSMQGGKPVMQRLLTPALPAPAPVFTPVQTVSYFPVGFSTPGTCPNGNCRR